MTVSELLYYCFDAGMLHVEIYDLTSNTSVYIGYGDEIPEEFEDLEICTWDIPTNPGELTINVEI